MGGRWEDRIVVGLAIMLGACASTALTASALRGPSPARHTVGWVEAGPVIPAHPSLSSQWGISDSEPRVVLLDPGLPVPSLDEPPHDFVAGSMRSGFSVRGAYVGDLAFEDDALVLQLDRAAVRSMGSSDGLQLTGIRLSVARSSGEGWHLSRRGRLVSIDPVDVSGASHFTLDPLRLVVEGVGYEDLADGWLVIEHELSVGSPDGPSSHPAWTYVHADREIGLRFLASLPGC